MKRVMALISMVVAVVCLSCKEGGNIAGGTDRLFLFADPPQIGVNGSSTLTVTGTDESGAPLPDGTRVSFSVDKAGRVSPNSVELLSGTATTTYIATLSAGTMTVTATSGSVQAQTTITVADDIQRKVFVSAAPATFPAGGGTSIISAIVTDNSGQPIENISVRFSTTAGTLQSGGGPIETNNNGLATDILNTSEDATVTATTEDGFSGETQIDVGVGQIVCHMTVNTSTPSVGQIVRFFDISDNPGNQIVGYHWNFDDGSTTNGQNVQHIYEAAGTYNVVHSVTDAQNNTYLCDPFPIVVSE